MSSGYIFNIFNNHKNELIFYGNIDIKNTIASFRLAGRIKTMNFEEGDYVKKGQIIATLDSDLLLNELDIAKFKLLKTQYLYNDLNKNYIRNTKLIKTNAISQAFFDKSLSSYLQAKTDLKIAESEVKKINILLADSKLKSPNDGIILTKIHEVGEIVSISKPIYSISLQNPVKGRIYINEINLSKIYVGKQVSIYIDSKPKTPYLGKISFISPQAEFTPKTVETVDLRTDLVYLVRINVVNPDNNLKQGIPITVKLNY